MEKTKGRYFDRLISKQPNKGMVRCFLGWTQGLIRHFLYTWRPFLDKASLTIASGASCGLSKALKLLERDTALKTTATKVQPMTLPEPHQMLLHPMSSNRKPFSRASSLGRNDPLHHNWKKNLPELFKLQQCRTLFTRTLFCGTLRIQEQC